MLSANQVLDRYYPEVRAWLIQIAAVMDRYDRAAAEDDNPPDGDQRLEQFRQSLQVLAESKRHADRAERIQVIFSDPVD